MLISISRRHKSKKSKGKKSSNPRSVFLKAFFGVASGDFANSMMDQYMSGNYEKFTQSWHKLSERMLEKAKDRAKELGKLKDDKNSRPNPDSKKESEESQETQTGGIDEN